MMVTTRSADKRTSTSVKEENLALRSKPDHETLSTENAIHSTPTPGLSKRKGRIQVNVPPPRKRTRLSHDDAGEDEVHPVNPESRAHVRETKSLAVATIKIRDSQDSPVKAGITENVQILPQHSVGDRVDEMPGLNAKRQPNLRTAGKPSSETQENKHKRFGSSEPIESDLAETGANAEDLQTDPSDGQQSGDESDDAPEAITTKVQLEPIATHRKARTKRSQSKAQHDQKKLMTTETNIADVAQRSSVNEPAVKPAMTPILKVNTVQNEDSQLALGSEDSNDSAFVTARTHRHIDVFSTPQDGTPHIKSPAYGRFGDAATNHIAIRQPLDKHIRHSITDARDARPLKSRSVPSSSGTGSSVLPRKAGNTFETYRRQTLQNRADKDGVSRRGAKFKLQDEWPSKRSNFVVGF